MVRRALFWLFASSLGAQSIVIRQVRIIDATGAPATKPLSVAIDGDRIAQIAKKIPHVPRTATIVDGKGKFLIPGLWDMHIHLGPPEIFFPLLVANGITGVREMFTGIPMPVIRQWRARPDVPRIFAPGFLDGPPMLWSGPAPPGAFAVATAEQGRDAVIALARSGVDFLKIYSSVPREAYFAIVEEAHAIGIPFAGHVPETVSPLEASDAGQRSEEHLNGILLACSTQEEQLRKERVAMMLDRSMPPEERMRELAWPDSKMLDESYDEHKAQILFRTFATNGTWQTPTLALLEGFARAREEDFVHDPRRKYLLKAWNEQWDPRKTYFLKDLSPEQYGKWEARVQALLERYEKLVGDMHRAGVEFLAGTDANGYNPIYPGFGLHEELKLLVKSGLSPMEALQSATRNAAVYFGQLPAWGTVEKGKSADLVLLDANPLEDISNTQKIAGVVMRGRYYSRADLDRMLEHVAERAAR
ncbi:MAG TPA: amidohydrolase family protein [Bryobacteraceae bacterium]|nr:amidohydrolase family protein [Bryobacteraceae bacterium]